MLEKNSHQLSFRPGFSPFCASIMRAALLCVLIGTLTIFFFFEPCIAISASERSAILELAAMFPLLSTTSSVRPVTKLWNVTQVDQVCGTGVSTFTGLTCSGNSVSSLTMFVSHPIAISPSFFDGLSPFYVAVRTRLTLSTRDRIDAWGVPVSDSFGSFSGLTSLQSLYVIPFFSALLDALLSILHVSVI